MTCQWAIDVSCCQATWDAADEAARTRATNWAVGVLWALTGRRFGPCAITVRPCEPLHPPTYETFGIWGDSRSGGGWTPFLWAGSWRNCSCAGSCGCGPRPGIDAWLPGPIYAISEVRVDGVVLDPSAYRVDNGTWLVRQDGGTWPQFQDYATPADEAFTVTYFIGSPVPAGGAVAAGTLACEFLRACAGGPCRFPKRVTSVSRQGVTVSAQETISAGSTGIPEVDAWVRAINPGGLREAPAVYSIDAPTARVVTWTA